MVDTKKCELCGTETKYYVSKEINGLTLYFCCRGCQDVYEMMHDEGLSNGSSTEGQKPG
jgi:hypothetical protein